MRQPLHVLRFVVILWVLSVSALAHADDRADARAHYQTAAKMYQGGDYRGAIREFSAAQQLVPADLNNYNLALCYDKLGDAEPAIQYYRAFLDKQPGTDKRAEIEASINRLDAALKSASAKKAEEAKRADDAKKAEEAKKAEDDKRPVLGPVAPDAAALAGGAAAGAAAGGSASAGIAVGPAAPAPTVGPEAAPAPSEAAPAPSPAPRKKHKGPAVAAPGSTGDPQLDRVNALNIDEIRDQRLGPQGEAAAGNPGAKGPAVAGTEAAPPAQPNAQGSVTGVAPMNNPGDEPKKETPIYKKWWFWAVVAVGGYVVYQLATSSSSSNGDTTVHPATAFHHAPTAGLTLLHF